MGYMLQSSRLFLCDRCSPQRKEPLSVYEATECAIHLNAYYLNLRGTLDNLAWVLQYEWGLLANVAEDTRGRLGCNLFGRQFLKALKARHAALGVGRAVAVVQWRAACATPLRRYVSTP